MSGHLGRLKLSQWSALNNVVYNFFIIFRHRHAEDHLCAALKVPVISCA